MAYKIITGQKKAELYMTGAPNMSTKGTIFISMVASNLGIVLVWLSLSEGERSEEVLGILELLFSLTYVKVVQEFEEKSLLHVQSTIDQGFVNEDGDRTLFN